MKILYITPAFQHPQVRGPHRCYHFIRELSPRHEITLLTLKRSEIPPKALQEVAAYLKEMRIIDAAGSGGSIEGENGGALGGLGRKLQNDAGFRAALAEMKQVFREMVRQREYDLVLFHGKSVFPVIEDWKGLPIVIDFCDATSMRFRDRMKFDGLLKRALLIRRYREFKKIEKKLIAKSPHVAFISARDRDASLDQQNGTVSLSNRGFKIIPIGVDLEFWKRKTRNPGKRTIIFTGVMNYRPNEDAALYLIKEILPRALPKLPDLEVLIVGRDPTAALKQAAATYPKNVVVTGFVEDVRTYLERAALFVAPIRYGSGIQNKVLEALAMEVPVLCTPVVADGLLIDEQKQPPVRVAEGAEKFAAELARLLGQPEELAGLARQGREYVEQHFVWSHSAELLEKMCLEAVAVSR
ncbi:MAG: glycosyltransferase [Calditrichaceae bacterium]|nr:glycosyltransferase family 4 protein [Calditrichia bacterium]NUQ41322.1 glycosyltransferase [Calditrichaceae bacterium]